MLDPSSVEKITEIDEHIGCAMSGLSADARTMINHARIECQNYRFTYNEPMTVESCTQSTCDLALKFGEHDDEERGMSRPFGVALLIAGVDEKGPRLFHADPSGTFVKYYAIAIGAGSEGAQTTLQEEYHKSISFADAEKLALQILKQVMEEKINSKNVEVGCVTLENPKFVKYDRKKIQSILEELKSNCLDHPCNLLTELS